MFGRTFKSIDESAGESTISKMLGVNKFKYRDIGDVVQEF